MSRCSLFVSTATMSCSLAFASSTSADIIGAVLVPYEITAADFGGAEVTVYVQDLYLVSDDPADTLLNIYNCNLPPDAQIPFFQSFTGTGWRPTNLGGPFDTEALRYADSFVTIGGFPFGETFPPGYLGPVPARDLIPTSVETTRAIRAWTPGGTTAAHRA